jgi:integral membrane protein
LLFLGHFHRYQADQTLEHFNYEEVFTTTIGRLRLFAFLEGISLIALVFIAVPLKYYFDNPSLSKNLGPIHGALFLLFVFNALRVGIEQQWKFKETTWKIVVACFIPFGTFYIDYKILRKIQTG